MCSEMWQRITKINCIVDLDSSRDSQFNIWPRFTNSDPSFPSRAIMRTHGSECMSRIHFNEKQQPFFTVKRPKVSVGMYCSITTTQDDGTHLVQKT